MNTHFIGVLQALDYINEGGADYQKEYRKYVDAHKERVSKFSSWLQEKCPDLFNDIDVALFDEMIRDHDDSKYSEEDMDIDTAIKVSRILKDVGNIIKSLDTATKQARAEQAEAVRRGPAEGTGQEAGRNCAGGLRQGPGDPAGGS